VAETNAGDVLARLVLDISAWRQGLQQAAQEAQQFQQRFGQVRLPDLQFNTQAFSTNLRQVEQEYQQFSQRIAAQQSQLAQRLQQQPNFGLFGTATRTGQDVFSTRELQGFMRELEQEGTRVQQRLQQQSQQSVQAWQQGAASNQLRAMQALFARPVAPGAAAPGAPGGDVPGIPAPAQLQQSAQGVQALSQSFTGLGTSIASATLALLGLNSATRVLQDLIDSGTRLETLRVGLTTFAGSAQASAEAFALVQQQAQRLGFDVVTLTAAYKELLGSGRDTILSTQDLARMFTQLTDGVKAAGGSSEQAAQLVVTFAQALNRGEITARQLHASMQGLPGLQGILARALHLTTDELRGQAAEHTLMANVTLPLLGNQIERELGGRTEAAANTVQSAFARLQSAFATLGNNLIAGPFGDFLKLIAAELQKDIELIERIAGDVQQLRGEIAPPAPLGGEEGIRLRDIGARRQAAAEEVERLRAQEAGGPGGGIFPGTQPRQLREEAEANLRRLNAEYAAQQAIVDAIVEKEEAAAQAAADQAVAQKRAADAAQQQQDALDDARRVQLQLNELAERYQHIQERAAEAIARDPAARERIIQQQIRDLEQLRRQIDDLQADAARRGAALPGGVGAPPIAAPQGVSAAEWQQRWQAAVPLLQQAARAQGMDPALAIAVAIQESGLNPLARGRSGEQGIMQLMPGTAQGLGVTQPFDLAQNIQGGVRYLAQQLQRFGTVPEALAAYNAGPGAVQRYGGIPPAAAPYVQSVQALQGQLQGFGGAAPTGGAPFAAPDIQAGIEQLKLLQDFIKNRQALIKQYLDAQTAVAQLTMTPEELQATAVERANLAAVQQRLLETQMARAPQAMQTSLQAALRAMQEVVGAAFAEFTLRDVRERVAREFDSMLATIRQRTQELRRALPRENLALQQPDLAAQLGLDVDAEGRRAVASQRAQAAAAALPGIFAEADPARRQQALEDLRKQLDVQDQLYGAQALQALQNQTRALQEQLSVRGQSLEVQQREAIVQRELQRLRDEGQPITPELEAQAREQAAGLVRLQRALESARRPLQEFGEQYESVFVKMQEVTLSALQKTESALVDFFSGKKMDLRGLLDALLRDLTAMATRVLITKPLASAFDQLFNVARGLLPTVASAAAPGPIAVEGVAPMSARAMQAGGLITRPTLALLGERGPEMVIPMTPGSAFGGPARAGGGAPVSLTMNVYGVQDAQSFRATQGQIMRGAAMELQRQLIRNG